MNGIIIVALGIGLMFLVLSGKLDCLIAAFRACAGASETLGQSGASGQLPELKPKEILDNVLSNRQ